MKVIIVEDGERVAHNLDYLTLTALDNELSSI